MFKLYVLQLPNKMADITWIYIDAKFVPRTTFRRWLNSNWWAALCDLNWDKMGSIQPPRKAVRQSTISLSYVKRLGKLVDKNKLRAPGDVVTGILARNQCAQHKT